MRYSVRMAYSVEDIVIDWLIDSPKNLLFLFLYVTIPLCRGYNVPRINCGKCLTGFLYKGEL